MAAKPCGETVELLRRHNPWVSVKWVVFGDEFSVTLLLMIKPLFLTRPVATSSNMFP